MAGIRELAEPGPGCRVVAFDRAREPCDLPFTHSKHRLIEERVAVSCIGDASVCKKWWEVAREVNAVPDGSSRLALSGAQILLLAGFEAFEAGRMVFRFAGALETRPTACLAEAAFRFTTRRVLLAGAEDEAVYRCWAA